MQRMFTLKLAILHLLQTTGGIAFFFGRRIVAPFALGAFQNNQFAHFRLLSKVDCLLMKSRTVLMAVREFLLFRINCRRRRQLISDPEFDYSMISETRPEATVRPPSRIAKRRPFSIAMGAISSTVMEVLSPGMTISVPSARVMEPVTSVVRKKN